MKLKFLHLALFALLPSCIMAQKKQFTLDDLLPGGKTYYQNSVPENKYLTLWGNECVMLEVDRCYVIDKKTGKVLYIGHCPYILYESFNDCSPISEEEAANVLK